MTPTYKMLKVTVPTGQHPLGVYVLCSDENVIQLLAVEALRIMPSAKIDYSHFSLVSNLPFQMLIKKLNNKDYLFGLNMVQIVCEQGWKPLTVTHLGVSGDWEYVFSKEISQ
jgi:hypothetical protein